MTHNSCEAELGGNHRESIYGIGIQNYWFEMFGESLQIEIGTDSSAGLGLISRQGIGKVRHLDIK